MPSFSPLGLSLPERAVVVAVSGEITSLKSELARKQLQMAWNAKRGIALHLSTNGGEIFSALHVARCVAASPDLVCLAERADSAGLLLVAAAPYRLAPRAASFIFHEASMILDAVVEAAGAHGGRLPRSVLARMMADVLTADEDALDFLAGNWRCSRRMIRDLQRQNASLTAPEMLRRGLIDGVV